MSKLFFLLILIILLSTPALADGYNMTNPHCDEGKLYYYGGESVFICQNGVTVPYLTCPYGVNPEANGNYTCNESPNPCVQNPNAPGCQSTDPLSILLFFIIVIIIIAIIFFILRNRKKKETPKNQKKGVKYCSKCGSSNKIEDKFCASCGKELKE